VVLALFGYVYRSTASYVLSRSDQAIAAEHAVLDKAYRVAGRSRLVAAIERSIADERFEGGIYLLADPSLTPVAGNQPVFVAGDRDLLFDTIANLVDNAIKHGREAGRVTVEVMPSDGEAVISVSDDGPGLSIDEHANVFKRFYRLERSRSTPGSGLGLSVVAAVARLHGARIEMFDNRPGLKVELRFPPTGCRHLQSELC